jgi:hypothetical protein
MTTPDFWKPLRELTFEDVDSLRTSGDREKATLDYKRFNRERPLINTDGIAEDFTAFANSGGGRLILGAIEEDDRLRELQGVSEDDARRVRSTIRNIAHLVQPPVDLDTRDIQLPDGTYTFVVDIAAGQPGPFQFRGKYLQRASSGNVPMPHTSVVNAVLATSREGGDLVDLSAQISGLHLGDNPPATQGRVWACGVQLLPVHRAPKAIYDPLNPPVEGLMKTLRGRDYKEVSAEMEKLTAKSPGDQDFQLSANGRAVAIKYTDAGAPAYNDATPLTDVASCFEQGSKEVAARFVEYLKVHLRSQ